MKLSESLKDQILIALFCAAAYATSIFNDFYSNDWAVLALLKNGFSWQKFLWMEDVHYLRPVTNFFLYLRYIAFGQNPMGYNIIDILMHLVVCLLLYDLLRKLEFPRMAAFYSALIFAIYFQHYEAITWIYGIARPIDGIFWLLGLMTLYDYLKEGSFKSLLLFSVLSFLGLLSCEEFVIAPVGFILFVIFISEKRKFWQRFRLVSISISIGLICYVLLRFTIMPRNVEQNYLYSFGSHIVTRLFEYLGWMIIPSPDHGYFVNFAHNLGQPIYWLWKSAFWIATISMILAMIYLLIRSSRIIKFFVIFIPLTLLLILPFGFKVVPRYIYIPSIALSAIAGYYFNGLLQKLAHRPHWRTVAMTAFSLFVLTNIAAIGVTSHEYQKTQHLIRGMVADINESEINLHKYRYLLLDHLPGRVGPGSAFYYYFSSADIIASNDIVNGPIDIPKAAAGLASQGKSFVVFDYQNGHLKEATQKYVAPVHDIQ